jgi:hypothetical protein
LTTRWLAFREAHRLLDVGGLLMFSTFGPDTLKELRASFNDGHVHTQRFTDMHDYGDMLLECGFSDPVMDAELLTMTYASFDQLLIDLRQSGSTCAMQARSHGLTGRAAWAEGTRGLRAARRRRWSRAGDGGSGLRPRLESGAEKNPRRAEHRPLRPAAADALSGPPATSAGGRTFRLSGRTPRGG